MPPFSLQTFHSYEKESYESNWKQKENLYTSIFGKGTVLNKKQLLRQHTLDPSMRRESQFYRVTKRISILFAFSGSF